MTRMTVEKNWSQLGVSKLSISLDCLLEANEWPNTLQTDIGRLDSAVNKHHMMTQHKACRPYSTMSRLTFHASKVHLQCLLHGSVNVIFDCVTTEEHLHWERPTRNVKSRDITKELGKPFSIHSGRSDDEFEIFASCYHLCQSVPISQAIISLHC